MEKYSLPYLKRKTPASPQLTTSKSGVTLQALPDVTARADGSWLPSHPHKSHPNPALPNAHVRTKVLPDSASISQFFRLEVRGPGGGPGVGMGWAWRPTFRNVRCQAGKGPAPPEQLGCNPSLRLRGFLLGQDPHPPGSGMQPGARRVAREGVTKVQTL